MKILCGTGKCSKQLTHWHYQEVRTQKYPATVYHMLHDQSETQRKFSCSGFSEKHLSDFGEYNVLETNIWRLKKYRIIVYYLDESLASLVHHVKQFPPSSLR